MVIKRWLGRRKPGVEPQLRVLMVCTGNICRSPTAEAVMRHRLQAAGLGDTVAVDSAGTQDFHRGSPPDARAIARATLRGYRLQGLRARPVVAEDFERFGLILAMDRGHLDWLRAQCPPGSRPRIELLLCHHTPENPASNTGAVGRAGGGPGAADATGASHAKGGDEVPDPYYGSLAGFDHVLDLVEPACTLWVEHIRRSLSGPSIGQR